MKKRCNIKNLSYTQLKEVLKQWDISAYRAGQLIQWIYQKDVSSFEEMTNLSKSFRQRLADYFVINRLVPLKVQESIDGTKKFLFELDDKTSIESVLIPQEGRRTLCISSQVGCAMGCKFCLTGTLGLTRQLTQFEILEQVMACQRILSEEEKITNVVFMGMGEPLHNFEMVLDSLEVLVDQQALGLAPRRVTVSTCGLVPQIETFGEKTTVKLAVSLSAPNDLLRSQLMPINKTYPLKKLLRACKKYTFFSKKPVTFEYTLIKDVNDSLEHAHELAKILGDISVKVNLISFNSFPGTSFEGVSVEEIKKFQNVLYHRGIQTNIRQSRGQDILGACGQLKAAMDQGLAVLPEKAVALRLHQTVT